ncbi:MAG: protein translocase subunit SecD [Candidatus Hydrogenedens sp.]|nr:protein translocase subunit SecD [Candidatus Hydrogenedens sp.]
MQQSIQRTILIWVVVALAAFNVVPTIGWMSLSEDARAERLKQWAQEDLERAKDRPGAFTEALYSLKRWSEFDRDRVINLGLDLQGGLHMVVSFDWQDLGPERLQEYYDRQYTDADIEKEIQQVVLQQISRRVNDFEAKEPIIQALGTNQVQIQLPGEKDVTRAVNLIKKTAQLNFHIVAGQDETVPVFTEIKNQFETEFLAYVSKPEPGRSSFRVLPEHYEGAKALFAKAAETPGLIPDDKMIAFSQPPKPYATEQFYDLYLLEKTPLASGEGLDSAGATPDPSNPPHWQIMFSFNNAAAADFGKATQANINRAMAIVIDDSVISAPVIRDRISAHGTITGNFMGEEARDLAIALNSGSMVVPVHEEFTRVVGPSLGAQSVNSGVTSALAGIGLVGLFILVYYLAAGVVAVISLSLNALFLMALMAYFGMTLTLPGIAGLILTIGMAVDSNVLIFERIREELRLGHSLKSSVESGFQKATSTILDANVTTLIAAMVLFQFGTGPIQGFAVTLSVGVVTSVFAALILSRALMDFALNRGLVKQLKMFSLFKPDLRIPFLAGRTPAAAASALCIIAGLVIFGVRGEGNFGVDFTEGTNLQLAIDNPSHVTAGDVRADLEAAGFANPIVQLAGLEDSETMNEFLIRVSEIDRAQDAPPAEGDTVRPGTVAERIQQAVAPLSASGDVSGVTIEDAQTVGPAAGAQLRWDAMQSVFYSLLFIIIYLTFRFELKFAIAAVVALVHDVIITLGVFSLLGREISLPVVAAVLTVIGYSLNDTIIVFDRIREDLQVYRSKGLKLAEVINISINETLGRTTLTSLTTLFVCVVLFLFGGPAINDFALILIVGILVGTYSSIFIASALVWFWSDIMSKRQAAEMEKDAGKRKKSAKKTAATAS